ncbi:MAG: TlpA disulfide reductase family protein [Chitinophagales bacterium]|nr:TlpA family protein disulfide reductase [Chitinophagales bacterium]MDW8393521.1 TlpA disulfide reductase family protein [Chitinophagales bacterium]
MLSSVWVPSLMAQDKMLPPVTLKDLQGNAVNVSQLASDGKIVVLNFWATWCVPCKKELTNIAKVYGEWQEKYQMELIAVSVDDARNVSKVKPTVQGSRWPYRVLLDPNGELKRQLGFQNVPFTVMAGPGGKIVYQHAGYVEGDEFELEKRIKELREQQQ